MRALFLVLALAIFVPAEGRAVTLTCEVIPNHISVSAGSYLLLAPAEPLAMLFSAHRDNQGRLTYQKIPIVTESALGTYGISRVPSGCRETRTGPQAFKFECRNFAGWGYFYGLLRFDARSATGNYYERGLGRAGEMPVFSFKFKNCR